MVKNNLKVEPGDTSTLQWLGDEQFEFQILEFFVQGIARINLSQRP